MSAAATRAWDVVRAPNHLGDLVMALPALRLLEGADLVVARWLAPLLDLAARGDREAGLEPAWGDVLPLERGAAGLLRAAMELRRRRHRTGVLLTPSASSALLFRLGGVRHLRGTATDGRGWVVRDPRDPELYRGLHRAQTYLDLVAGEVPPERPVPRLRVPRALRERWWEAAGAGEAPRVGLCPGSNASSRRWDPERFAELARGLRRRGAEVHVFGGPGEREITAAAAGGAARDWGGRTDLALLAAGLADCDVVVSNDSGPLHLAAAVGTPTVSLWGAGDPGSTGVTGPEHVMLREAELPCVPCVKNECPRADQPGYRLVDGERECLRLLTVDAVQTAALRRLGMSLT